MQPVSDWFLMEAAYHEGFGWLFQILGVQWQSSFDWSLVIRRASSCWHQVFISFSSHSFLPTGDKDFLADVSLGYSSLGTPKHIHTEAWKEKDYPAHSQVLTKKQHRPLRGLSPLCLPPSAALCCSAKLPSLFCNGEQGSLLECLIAFTSELGRYLEARWERVSVARRYFIPLPGGCCLLISEINGHWLCLSTASYESSIWTTLFQLSLQLKCTSKLLYFAKQVLVGKLRSSTCEVHALICL